MSDPAIIYVPRSDANPQPERDALSNVYRFIFACQAKKKGTDPGAPDDAERSPSDIRAKTILHQDP